MYGSDQGHREHAPHNQVDETDTGCGLQTGAETAEAGAEATEEVKTDNAERIAKISAYTKALESYDRIVVTIAGGALTVSVAFVHQIAPVPVAGSLKWLDIGWAGFVFCLGTHVLSMLAGHAAMESDLEEDAERCLAFTRATTWLNMLATAGLLVGFIGLVGFARANAPGTAIPPPSSPDRSSIRPERGRGP